MDERRRNAVMRRYPALLGTAVFGLLALALPSSLTIPRTGPPTLAEFAPVPGQSSGVAAPIADLAQTSSAGIGSGGNAEGAVGESTATTHATQSGSTGPGGKARAGNKRCVGKPPRQTEDPMSPPCIAFFAGDNGGATAKGVTADEITVVVAARCNGNSASAVGDVSDPNDPVFNPTWAGFLRHFNERYQLYGRKVRLWWYSATCGSGEAAQQAFVEGMDERLRPFAIVGVQALSEGAIAAAASHRIWVENEGGPRERMSRYAPFVRSFGPDLEDRTSNLVSFICTKLAGRTATYSGELTDQTKTRSFALVYQRAEDAKKVGRDLLVDGVRDACGSDAGEVHVASNDYAGDVRRWRFSDGVTTIINVGDGLSHAIAADSTEWHPEWMVVPNIVSNLVYRGMFPPKQSMNAFAVWDEPRLAERVEDQHHFQALKEGCPDCTSADERAYYDLLLLFWGLQASGPRLTIENVDRGLHAIPQRAAPDPFNPAAYFTAGNWSFVKDMTVARWNPTKQLPGQPPGCWSLVEHGKRYRQQDWSTHPTDEDFTSPEWPCHGSQ